MTSLNQTQLLSSTIKGQADLGITFLSCCCFWIFHSIKSLSLSIYIQIDPYNISLYLSLFIRRRPGTRYRSCHLESAT